MPSPSNLHVSTSERVQDEQRAKAKTDSYVLTIQIFVGFAEKATGKHTGSGISGASAISRTSLPLKITIIMMTI